MKTINAPVRADGNFALDLDFNGLSRGSIKRRSRRQERHQLRHELQHSMAEHLVDAKTRPQQNVRPVAIPQTAVILQFPQVNPAGNREIIVIRKTPKQSFERQHIERRRLVA